MHFFFFESNAFYLFFFSLFFFFLIFSEFCHTFKMYYSIQLSKLELAEMISYPIFYYLKHVKVLPSCDWSFRHWSGTQFWMFVHLCKFFFELEEIIQKIWFFIGILKHMYLVILRSIVLTFHCHGNKGKIILCKSPK